jgi:hypothetical protein
MRKSRFSESQIVAILKEGESEDATRVPHFYVETYAHLRSVGVPALD